MGLRLAVPRAGSPIRGPADFLISWVLPALAAVACWRYRSATPGKMIVSAWIVDARSGQQPSLVQCLVRYFAYVLSALPLGLGFVWIAFDPRKQAWHDKLAGTVVTWAAGRAAGRGGLDRGLFSDIGRQGQPLVGRAVQPVRSGDDLAETWRNPSVVALFLPGVAVPDAVADELPVAAR